MKKWLKWAGCLVLLLSLLANVYQYKQHRKMRHYVELEIGSAASLLNTAATMPIMPNVPNNSTQVRGMLVAEAASHLSSAAPFLDELGVHHILGIGALLTIDSFPLMYPDMRIVEANQMLKLVQFSSSQLNACFTNGLTDKLNFSKLQTAINNIYQEMPAKDRQSNYNDTSP